MEHVIRGLSFLLIPIIVSGVLAFLRQPKKAEAGKVYYPKFFAIIGIITSTVFLVFTLITAFSDEPLWVPILFFSFSLLGAGFIIAFINCRISYDEDGFVARNFFGAKRRFTYDQVTAIKENMHEAYLYNGERKVLIDELSVGGRDFITYAKKRYRTIHNGQALPKIKKSKRDIFNGNVEDAAGFIFAYILMSVLILATAIFLVWYVYLSPSTVDNTIKQEVSFTSLQKTDDEIRLTSLNNKLYKIRFIDDDFHSNRIKALCDGKTVVTTYSTKVTPDDGDDYYSIHAIYAGDTCLLSFEETNRWYQKEHQTLLLFPAVFALLWGVYIAGSIIVGRNPKKFSKNVIHLYFKEGYVKY